MAAEGDDGAGGMVTMYFCGEAGRYDRSPCGSNKRSTELTSTIPTQKSKDASRTQNPAFASTCVLRRGKTSKDASRTEDKTQKKITKYTIKRMQLASVRSKPTLL